MGGEIQIPVDCYWTCLFGQDCLSRSYLRSICVNNHQVDIGAHFIDKAQVKDMTSPQQIREMMQLDFSELNSRKPPGTELVQSIKDRRFCQIKSSEIQKNHLGNWEAPLPFKRDEVNLPNNREQCVKRLSSLKKKLSNDRKAKKNYVNFMQKIFDRQHASRVPTDELTGPPGKVWYLPHFDVYQPLSSIVVLSFVMSP